MRADSAHSDASSNSDAAETVAETVMAEQVGDNVVIDSVSASASAPADVAANPITTDSAAGGNSTADDDVKQTNSTTETAAEAISSDPAALNGDKTADSAEKATGSEGQAEDAGPSLPTVTEGGKADAPGTDQKKEDGHHVRTNSVKKQTTFSKVSATRNFLAKAASPAPTAAAPPKLGDKPSPLAAPTQPAVPRARLIAKTASNLQSVQRPRPGAEGAGAPDASKVWNKNRPVPPAPPKHFTDEELKQQYGIHLATRLQTDEGGKEAKWADIDEDEDDWAPEAVVWMDGTKSTLTPAEATAAEEALQAVPAPAEKPALAPKPTVAVKKTELGPQKTILKPGVAALQAKQQPNGPVAGSATDKPSLKAKSPAPTPAKSPWAALPPMEAVSPINPPVQQAPSHPTSLPTQDARAYEPQAPSLPAREIAADTFDRSWREGEGAPRELFNSSNGRYEPAPEGRRTSIRPESGFRKPSLLQRPSQGGPGPAEPSAAFQSRTSSQMDGSSYGRRRGSSVSQGSLPSARRMSSVSRPNDLPTPVEEMRRQSLVTGHDMRASPVSARGDVAKPAFAQQSAWDQQMPPRPEPSTEVEDPVKVQQRIMREKRETAKKRREEEDARETREKEERLKAKMALLGGAGKSRKEREAEAAAEAAAKRPNSEKPSEPKAPAEKVNAEVAPTVKPAEASAQAAPALEDQTVPVPVQPTAIQEQLPSPVPPKPAQPAGLPERPVASADEAQRQAPRAHLSPRVNARAPFSQQPSPYRPPQSSYSPPGDRKQQPFGRSPLGNNDAFSGWNTTASNGNVWGTSGIGNGTFGDSSSFAPHPTSQQTSALPPPPGMGRPPTNNRISPQGPGQDARSPNMLSQQPMEQQQQRAFPPPGIDSRPDVAWGASRNNGPSPAPGLGRQTHLPAPIAPPSRAQLQQQQQRQDPISSWNNAAARLPHQYAAEAEAAARKQQEPVAPSEHVIAETFKKTAPPGKLGASRKFESTEHIIHDAQGSRTVSTLSPAPPSTQTQPIGPVLTASPANVESKAPSDNTVRIPDGSQNAAHGGMPVQQPPIALPHMRKQQLTAYNGNVNFPTGPLPGVPTAPLTDRSPPPPETTSHPVFSGDVRHPHIKLPPPSPRVRLPPAASVHSPPQAHHMPMSMPQRHVPQFGPPGSQQPIAKSNEWQARFNGLFNRANITTEIPPSPPKTPPKTTPKMQGPALAITSSSKALLDDMPSGASATVSLPASPPRRNVTAEGFTIDSSSDATSKPTLDLMFREELSFGSKPAVQVPRNAMYDRKIFTPPQHNLLKMPLNAHAPLLLTRPVEPQSYPVLTTTWWPRPSGGIYVKIHGTRLQNSNKLVRSAATTHGKAKKLFGDRKPSVQLNKGKEGNAKGSGTNTPTPATTPNTGSRQASFQKASAPGSAAAVAPAPATAPAASASAETVGRRGWTPQHRGGGGRGRGRGRGAPVQTTK